MLLVLFCVCDIVVLEVYLFREGFLMLCFWKQLIWLVKILEYQLFVKKVYVKKGLGIIKVEGKNVGLVGIVFWSFLVFGGIF